MNCFYCELEPRAGGTRITASTAVAICVECGAGVCSQHSQRQSGAIQKILCPACAAAVTSSNDSNVESIRSAS